MSPWHGSRSSQTRNSLLPHPNIFLAQVRNLKQAANQASDAASQAKFDLSALQQEGEQLRDQVVQVGGGEGLGGRGRGAEVWRVGGASS